MNNKPYNVCSAHQERGKTYWTVIGVAFPNRNGPGFSIILNALPPAKYGQVKLSIFPRKTREELTEETQLPIEA